jgi:hypothetical protein
LSLINLMNEPQTATVIINIDGRAEPLRFERTMPACSAEMPTGIHMLPEMPETANFRTTVRWPKEGSALLIMRSIPKFWTDPPVIPPVDRVR